MAPVVAQKAFAAAPVAQSRVVRAAPVKAAANSDKFQAVTIGAAAAFLLSATPASAGVVLEQPKLKSAFVADDQAKELVKKAPATADAKAENKEKAPKAKKETVPEATSSDGFDVKALWPLGIVAAGGALFGLSKIDSGFEDLFDRAVKDPNVFGIGTEDALKNTGGYAAPYYEQDGADTTAKGTKMLKKTLFSK